MLVRCQRITYVRSDSEPEEKDLFLDSDSVNTIQRTARGGFSVLK